MESGSADIDMDRANRWLIASAVVVFVCGFLAIVLPLTFSIGVAELLGWLFIFAALAHLIFGVRFRSGTLGWHTFIAALYRLPAINYWGIRYFWGDPSRPGNWCRSRR